MVNPTNCGSEIEQSEPIGAYGRTKREAEIKLLELGRISGMHVVIVRPSLVYGPGMKGNLKLMLKGIDKGWFPPLPNTENKRSMIHVDDLVKALIMVAVSDRTNGEIFIATDGRTYSSYEIYRTMCELSGKSIPKWSVPRIVFDLASKINKRIQYKIQKLLGDECYSSKKLESIGFRAKNSIKQMHENETFF
jgi:nucleoside-diphosphate-sugar epimerase